ncbi:hypothetical protein [Phenylobacterium sp.]|uniref:hypothetical protein n=1 Tax=Phenylobacterium sp. TaxID=1871053 RepID=UPI0027354C44|nr:hypothetical protein [Phenylobacterium sp.]MDP1598999.1 hypothetical protein [Phenylobacterium sp.]MDP3590427.1 hypothetical protein [Phenylobacterium sp.]
MINEGVAAWAQFLGALLAVFASYKFAASEATRARAELEETRKRDAEFQQREEANFQARLRSTRLAASTLASHGADLIEVNLLLFKDSEGKNLVEGAIMAAADFKGFESQLLAFPLHQLDNHLAITAFSKVVACATTTRSLLDHMQRRSAAGFYKGPVSEDDRSSFEKFAIIFKTGADILRSIADND